MGKPKPITNTYSITAHLFSSLPFICLGWASKLKPKSVPWANPKQTSPHNIGLGLKPPLVGKPKTHSSSQLGLGDGHVGYNGYVEHEDEGGMSYGREEHDDEGGMVSQA